MNGDAGRDGVGTLPRWGSIVCEGLASHDVGLPASVCNLAEGQRTPYAIVVAMGQEMLGQTQPWFLIIFLPGQFPLGHPRHTSSALRRVHPVFVACACMLRWPT